MKDARKPCWLRNLLICEEGMQFAPLPPSLMHPLPNIQIKGWYVDALLNPFYGIICSRFFLRCLSGDSLSWCCLCRQMTIPTTFDSWYDNERFLSFRTELVKPEIIFAIKVGTIDVVTTYLSSDFHSGSKSLHKVSFYYITFIRLFFERYNNKVQ